MDKEKDILLKTLEENELPLKSIFGLSFEKFKKPSEISEALRKKGNKIFSLKKHGLFEHHFVFYTYCKSIATASNKSENLALAYGNKSAFLFHIEKYEDCIKDIDHAMSFAKSHTLKIKLLCRKVECMKKLRLECENVVNDARHYLNKIDEDDKKAYSKLIKKVEALPVSENNNIIERAHEKDADNKLPEKSTTIGGFAIQCNESDGTHLVATKRYEPGEVIFVENFLVFNVDLKNTYIVCQYCLETCWSSVPCENCSWAMFCSDDCKGNACQEFHDIECSLIPYLKAVNDCWSDYHLSIRTLISSIKTAGSIAELRDELESMNKRTDVSFKGYFIDGKFRSDSIQNVFLLNCDNIPDNELDSMSLIAIIILIGLVKHTPLLEDIFWEDIDDLMANEDLIFLGSLLLKLMAIKSTNKCLIENSREKICDTKDNQQFISTNLKGSCFAPLTSLVKHSCVPNAARCFADDKKTIVYALLPIENDSQIVMNHFLEFEAASLKQRKQEFEKYKINCDCQACNDDWPPILHLSNKYLKKFNYAISADVEKKIYKDCKSILEAVKNEEYVAFTEKDIQKLSEAIKQAVTVKYPSYLTSLLIAAMNQVYSHLYGMKLATMKSCKADKQKLE